MVSEGTGAKMANRKKNRIQKQCNDCMKVMRSDLWANHIKANHYGKYPEFTFVATQAQYHRKVFMTEPEFRQNIAEETPVLIKNRNFLNTVPVESNKMSRP